MSGRTSYNQVWANIIKDAPPAAPTKSFMEVLRENQNYIIATGLGVLGLFGVYKLVSGENKKVLRKMTHFQPSELEPGTKICKDDVAHMVSSQIEAVSMYMDSMGTSGIKLTKKGKPISNKGVTCFLNSALQAFSSLPLMIDFLNTLEFPRDMDKEAQIIFELRACLIYLNSPEEGEEPLDTQPLIDALISKFPHLKDFFDIQQDTHEVILRLYEVVSDISEELARLLRPPQKADPSEADQTKISTTDSFYTPFSGKMSSIFTCSRCGYERTSSNKSFFDLAVHLPQDGADLLECIQTSLKPEIISNVHCGSCWLEEIPKIPGLLPEVKELLEAKLPELKLLQNKDYDDFADEVKRVLGDKMDIMVLKNQISAKRAQEKRSKIEEYPDIFVIKVERAVYDHRGHVGKAGGEMKFQETLTVAPGVDYQLCSVIEHLGTTHRRGHYICAKRNFIGLDPFLSSSELRDGGKYHFTNWILVSDENSWNIEFQRVQQLSGYILMFQRSKQTQSEVTTTSKTY